jgi:hypothetical protein
MMYELPLYDILIDFYDNTTYLVSGPVPDLRKASRGGVRQRDGGAPDRRDHGADITGADL